MYQRFLKYASVMLDAGPEIKDQIQENYEFLMNLLDRMNGEIAEAAGVDRATTMVDSYPSVAALCERCEPARVASGTRRPNGFFADLIDGFDLESLKKAIEYVIALAKLFGVELNLRD